MSEQKTQIKAGDTITAYGYDWEVLDPEYEGEDGPGILYPNIRLWTQCKTLNLFRSAQ